MRRLPSLESPHDDLHPRWGGTGSLMEKLAQAASSHLPNQEAIAWQRARRLEERKGWQERNVPAMRRWTALNATLRDLEDILVRAVSGKLVHTDNGQSSFVIDVEILREDFSNPHRSGYLINATPSAFTGATRDFVQWFLYDSRYDEIRLDLEEVTPDEDYPHIKKYFFKLLWPTPPIENSAAPDWLVPLNTPSASEKCRESLEESRRIRCLQRASLKQESSDYESRAGEWRAAYAGLKGMLRKALAENVCQSENGTTSFDIPIIIDAEKDFADPQETYFGNKPFPDVFQGPARDFVESIILNSEYDLFWIDLVGGELDSRESDRKTYRLRLSWHT